MIWYFLLHTNLLMEGENEGMIQSWCLKKTYVLNRIHQITEINFVAFYCSYFFLSKDQNPEHPPIFEFSELEYLD